MSLRLLPVGDRAVLVEPDDPGQLARLYRVLAGSRPIGVIDLVPAETTVLVQFDPTVLPPTAVGRWLRAAVPAPAPDGPPVGGAGQVDIPVEIPVRYDGADLAAVGRLTGLGAAGVVAAHTGTPWRVAFTGFAPGFGYLVDGDPRLQVPRRDAARTRVPAGSVALGGRYSGVYPRESPGGWQLLGRTSATVWDVDRDPPALLVPGLLVRFVAVGPAPEDQASEDQAPDQAPEDQVSGPGESG